MRRLRGLQGHARPPRRALLDLGRTQFPCYGSSKATPSLTSPVLMSVGPVDSTWPGRWGHASLRKICKSTGKEAQDTE